MREVEASDVEARLPNLLDRVERGETAVIMRHGKPIAQVSPEPVRRQKDIDAAIAEIKALRKLNGKIAIKELVAAKHVGHRR